MSSSILFFFFKQKTAYEMRISDWSSDVCSSDLQIGAAVNGQGGIVDWRTVTDDHHYAAILGPADQAVMRPEERLAIDVFLEQPFAHHQAEIASRPTPGFVGLLVDDMAQVIQAAWMGRPACGQPVFPRLSPFPGACRETEYFCLDATAFQGARQYVGADRGEIGRAHV